METLRRTELGGVPVWWAPDPGPLRAGLGFRVGMADEPVALRGVTHLAEHLALFELGRQAYEYNGTTGDHDTIFDVKGEPEEVLGHLRAVARALTAPPLDRFDDEVRVLQAEGLGRSNTLTVHLRQLRFGARTYGLRGKRELGLRRLTPEDLQRWVAERFTSANAVLWMTGEPPADLDLGLPAGGARLPMPARDPIPRLALPAYLTEEDPVVAVAVVGDEPDFEALRVTFAVARARLYDRLRRECALVYDVDQRHGVVGAGHIHAELSIDGREEDLRTLRDHLLRTLDELAGAGPTAQELAFEADQTRRYVEDPAALEGRLADAALDELHGLRPLVGQELLDALEGLTSERCAAALARALETAIVVAPDALDDVPDGLHPYAVGDPDVPPVTGREFRELDETECTRRPCRVTVGEHALHWRAGDGSAEKAIRFDEVAALIREAGDSHVLITVDDAAFELSPLAFREGDALRAALVAAVGDDRIVPLDARGRRVEAAGAAQLARRELLTEELYRLSRDLLEDEEVLVLAEAEDTDGPGMLALTDRRLIWHYVARGAPDDGDGFNETPRERLADVSAEPGVLRFRVGDDDEPTYIDRLSPPEAAARFAEELGGTTPAPPRAPDAEPAEERPRTRGVRELLRLRSR